MSSDEFEIFLATAPGLEVALAAEVRGAGFRSVRAVPGGVTCRGGWPDVRRANLEIRGASRVLARFAAFRAMHLAQLDKRARRVAWPEVLRKDVPFRVEATCVKSRIYHSGAAAERVARAIREELGAPEAADAALVVRVRIDDDLCTLAVDTSGELLHKRGFKAAVNKAPMRETLAALFLKQCGFVGDEPVLDPMCGSGTFVLEAAEIAVGLKPGRQRTFAFEHLASFDREAWQRLRAAGEARRPSFLFHGSDRDAGAIEMSAANAERAGVAALCRFEVCPVEALTRPEGPPGLVMVNPPYGDRIGEKGDLMGLYRALGGTLAGRFAGWRVGLVTSDPALARATALPFRPPGPPVLNGGIRVTLYQTDRLP